MVWSQFYSMQNNIHRQEENQILSHTYTMAKYTASLVLVLLVVTILNGYSAEGVGRDDELGKYDHVYESQKAFLPPRISCSLLHDWCLLNPDVCLYYQQYCPQPNKDLHSNAAKSGNSKIDSLP